MLIDWFTVAAQVINFLVLVWLLKRFLYKPILRAIDEREKRVAAELQEAQTQQAVAHQQQEEFQHKNELLEQQRAAFLSKAEEEAHAERRRLLEEARQEAEALRSKRQEALRIEQGNLRREIVQRMQNEVFSMARKALADLAATSLEERMAEMFLGRLRNLSDEDKARLTTNHNQVVHPALVRSAFDLPLAQKAALEGAIKEMLPCAAQVQFETVPEVVSGIELSMNGYKLAWSIDAYLAALEKSVGPVEGDAEHAS